VLLLQLEGHHIRVDRAAPPSAAAAAAAGGDAGSGRGGGNEAAGGVLYDPVRSVFVGNLDWKVRLLLVKLNSTQLSSSVSVMSCPSKNGSSVD